MLVNSSRFTFAENVDKVLKSILDSYADYVTEATTEVIPEVAKEAAKKLRADSPKGPKGYYKGWTYKVERGRMRVGAVVYGKHGTYQLAHLLEKGHALRGGGRQSTSAQVHIKPVEEWAVGEVTDRIIERLTT